MEKHEGDIIIEGATLADIARQPSIKIDDMSTLSKAILATWHKNRLLQITGEASSPLENFEKDGADNVILPGDKIAIGNDTVIVHGIQHSFWGAGKNHANEDLVQYVRGYVQKTTQNGDVWAAEEGMNKDFGITVTKPLSDIEEFMPEK